MVLLRFPTTGREIWKISVFFLKFVEKTRCKLPHNCIGGNAGELLSGSISGLNTLWLDNTFSTSGSLTFVARSEFHCISCVPPNCKVHHTGYIVLCVFFWWFQPQNFWSHMFIISFLSGPWLLWTTLQRTGAFSTAPMERREKYYMHSPKSEPQDLCCLKCHPFYLPVSSPVSQIRFRFRLQTAYANPGRSEILIRWVVSNKNLVVWF